MSNDTLWRLAQEQSGMVMTADAFRRWRERRAYTLTLRRGPLASAAG